MGDIWFPFSQSATQLDRREEGSKVEQTFKETAISKVLCCLSTMLGKHGSMEARNQSLEGNSGGHTEG